MILEHGWYVLKCIKIKIIITGLIPFFFHLSSELNKVLWYMWTKKVWQKWKKLKYMHVNVLFSFTVMHPLPGWITHTHSVRLSTLVYTHITVVIDNGSVGQKRSWDLNIQVVDKGLDKNNGGQRKPTMHPCFGTSQERFIKVLGKKWSPDPEPALSVTDRTLSSTTPKSFVIPCTLSPTYH